MHTLLQQIDPSTFSGNAIATILGAISLIVTAIGVPELFKNWKSIREMKYSQILLDLNETRAQLKEVKQELYTTRDQLKTLSTIVSVVIPMIKVKNEGDKDTLELIKIFERESGINLTPTEGNGTNP